MFPADFICSRAFISSSEAFLHFVGGTSAEVKPTEFCLAGGDGDVLYVKDAGTESTDQHSLSMFFTLSRFSWEQEHGKTGERGWTPLTASDFRSREDHPAAGSVPAVPTVLRLHGQCWTPVLKVLPQVDVPNPGKDFPAIYQHGNG